MQIYLNEEQYELLKQRSKQTGKPMSVHIRESLSKYLTETEQTAAHSDDPIWKLAGKASGSSKLSTDHDHYLYGQDTGGND